MQPSVILASASPQRKTLLEGLGVAFTVVPSAVQEDDHPEGNPIRRAADLARLKAKDIAAKHPGCIVIGCDTLVESANGTLLEKPATAEEARAMLLLHSGHTSLVHSALCVIGASGEAHEEVSTSAVTFKELTEAEVAWWLATEHWRDRSGGFQVDGLGQLMIERIEGDWTSIVGLPVFLLGKLLGRAGYSFVAA